MSADDTTTAVVRALLPPGTALRDVLLRQVAFAEALPGCRCGCPTVDLAVDRSLAGPAAVERGVVASAVFGPPDEVGGGVLLFAEAGYLCRLELYWLGVAPVTSWPAPHLLRLE